MRVRSSNATFIEADMVHAAKHLKVLQFKRSVTQTFL